MKIYFVLSLFFILPSFAMELKDLEKIYSKEGKSDVELTGKLKVFGKLGKFEMKSTITFHKMGKTLPLPTIPGESRLVDGKYIVSKSPFPDKEKKLYAHTIVYYDEKDEVYKFWHIPHDNKIEFYVGLANGNTVSWSQIISPIGFKSIMIEKYDKDIVKSTSKAYVGKELMITLKTEYKRVEKLKTMTEYLEEFEKLQKK